MQKIYNTIALPKSQAHFEMQYVFRTILCGRYYKHSHFIVETTEVVGNEVTSPDHRASKAVDPKLETRLPASSTRALALLPLCYACTTVFSAIPLLILFQFFIFIGIPHWLTCSWMPLLPHSDVYLGNSK